MDFVDGNGCFCFALGADDKSVNSHDFFLLGGTCFKNLTRVENPRLWGLFLFVSDFVYYLAGA